MEHAAIVLITVGLLCLLWANVQCFQELSELRKLLELHRKRLDNQGDMIALTAAHAWPEKREELLATVRQMPRQKERT